jgi:hypothetical protein
VSIETIDSALKLGDTLDQPKRRRALAILALPLDRLATRPAPAPAAA